MNKPRRTAPLISLSLVVALIASCSSPESGRVEIAHRATVIISAPGFTASDIEDFSTPFEQDDLSVLIEDLPDIAAFERPAGPVALISLGRRASSDWKAAEQGAEHLRSVAFVSVPALRNLETDQLKGVPLLELHSILDRETSVAHQSIHDALSVAGVPHEAVTYDGVGANFFAKGDPQPGVPRGGGLSGPRRRDRDGVSHRAMVSENDQELTQKDDTARWLLTSLPSSSCSGN